MEDLLPTESPSLTKQEAVRLLIQETNELANTGAFSPSIVNIDWAEIIDCNVRSIFPPSSLRSGKKRGNHRKWGRIPHRYQARGKNHMLLFDRTELLLWYHGEAVIALVKHYAKEAS